MTRKERLCCPVCGYVVATRFESPDGEVLYFLGKRVREVFK